MYKYRCFTGNKWEMAKIIMTAVCILLIIYQVSAGIKMIQANEKLPQTVTQEDFDTLDVGTQIRGELTHIDGTLYGDLSVDPGCIQYYSIITESQKIMLIRTISGSETDNEIHDMISGDCESVKFRGYVRDLSAADKTSLNLELITTNYLRKHGIDSGTQEAILGHIVDITGQDSQIPQKYITFTFAVAVILVLLIPLLLRKTIKNAYISLAIRKGKISEKILLDKNDYIFDDEGLYKTDKNQNESFYVNTKHNFRNEGTLEEGKEELMTHMVSQEDLFYEGGLNDDGNFYIDSTKKVQTLYNQNPDEDNLLKKY